ncbi:transposase [Facklamia sp. P12934]|uniref:transposase n=1 Tax=unclassified Facklamia TaxID=2622293 RepID=UPI003D173210
MFRRNHEIVEQISELNIRPFEPADGRPSYHHCVLIKALLFAYSEGSFSGRRLQKMMEEKLAMHWLTDQQIVFYRTINRF